MAQRSHSKKGSLANTSFTAADSKRQIQSILSVSNGNNIESKRQQLLSEKQNLKEKKTKLNAMKRNKLRSKSNATKWTKKGKDNKIVKEQQKISAEWMKISKEKDLLERQSLTLKKEKIKVSKQKNEVERDTKRLIEERKNVQMLHKKWRNESTQMLKKIHEKYTAFNNIKEKKQESDAEYVEKRRTSLHNHIETLATMSTNLAITQEMNESTPTPTPTPTPIVMNNNNNIDMERSRLNKLQKAAKDAQKRAEKTLSDLYRKKQELKKEELLIESERKKFKRLETEYNQFLKEKQRFKLEQKKHRKQEKYLEINKEKKSRQQRLHGANRDNDRERITKTKNVLMHHATAYAHTRMSTKPSNVGLISMGEQREYKELKKKVTMYQDRLEATQNQKKILQRKLAKQNKFANDCADDIEHNRKNNNTKYLISMLRSKVIEEQNRNKLLTKLMKRHKNVTDAYSSVNDLKMARKIITKLVMAKEDLHKKMDGMQRKIQKMKDLRDNYQTQLYKMYDDDDGDDDDGDDEFDLEHMSISQINVVYDSMKQKISELLLKNQELDDTLQDKETHLLQLESYANEYDIKHRLGQDRDKALYGQLRIEKDELQNKLDLVYSELEKERATASTWQNTIEDRLLQQSDSVGDDEKLILINQLKEENKKLHTLVGFNKKEDIKGHKAIAMDINEQFGSGLFNNLQYILMDADLSNDAILQLKIRDKNDEIYKVVLIKQSDNEQKHSIDIKPIVFEQKHMVKTLQDIDNVMHTYNHRISRIVDMLVHIKNSRKILQWNAISHESKSQKPKFDLVVSELRQISVPSSLSYTLNSPIDRHQKTMMKFVKTSRGRGRGARDRTESVESLDSIYDLSGDDNLTKFGIADSKTYNNNNHISSRISQFNRSSYASPGAGVYPLYPKQQLNEEKTEEEEEDLSGTLTQDDVGHIFAYYDKDNNGTISVSELIQLFQQLGVDISDQSKIESIVSSLDVDNDGIVTRDDFISWWFSANTASAVQTHFDSGVRSLLYLYAMGFEGHKSDELHAFAQYLNAIFSENENRSKISHGLDQYLPIDVGDGGRDILSKCVDGVLLSKMINFAVPNTIDERVLHLRDRRSDNIAPKQIVENLNIVLSSCKAIGVNVNISVETFLDPTYYEDIIRQILSELSLIHLSKTINLKDNPVLIRLAAVYEEDQDIKSLSAEVWLKRWINYQLKRSGEDIKIKNFGRDFRHGSVLCHVMQSVTKRKKRKHERFDINEALNQPPYARPQYVLKILKERFGLDIFLTPNDILIGNERLICLLCAQIFSRFKAMRKITKAEQKHVDDIMSIDDDDDNDNDNDDDDDDDDEPKPNTQKTKRKYKNGSWDTTKGRKRMNVIKADIIATDEKADIIANTDDHDGIQQEKDIINWMNEIFCCSISNNLKLSNLCRDLGDGLVLLKCLDLMSLESVDWDKVNKNKESEGLSRQQCLTNCHYIISLIKNEPFCSAFFGVEQLPSDAGNDIYCGNKAIIFKICYNLINYHHLMILTQLLGFKATSYDLIHWCNTELKKKLKYPRFCSFDERSLHHFSDSSLKSSLYYIDLLLLLSDDPRNDINRDIVIHKNNRQFIDDDYTESECLSNARYALSIARKFGAIFYISPCDLVEVRMPEITMSFVMSIMLLILNKNNQNKKKEDKSKREQQQIIIEDDSELQNIQRSAVKHGRKRSVLQEYGIITDNDQLEELQIIFDTPALPN